jgi:putative transposase
MWNNRPMLIAHRVALDPTDKQRTYFARAAGVARFAWNWALAEWQRQYAARRDDPSLPPPSEAALRRQLNRCKREQFPWMFAVTKCAAQEAIIDLGAGFRSFFEKRGRYPRLKKKGVRDSFCAANEAGTFRVDGRRIRLPVIGWIRMREAVRFTGKLKRVTVSREADRWFASVMVETDDVKPVEQPQEVVGVDLGITTLATLSDGVTIPGPRAHTALLGRLRRTSRSLSRKRKGSANRRKAKAKLARLHSRIAAIRRDATHKATMMLAKTYRRIGIEDLNVRGMARHRRLARSIMDGGFFALRRQLAYKARFYGASVSSRIAGFHQARPVLAAVWSRPDWRCRSGLINATPAGMRSIATSTPPAISNIWPQALRCQPVERNALARSASPA